MGRGSNDRAARREFKHLDGSSPRLVEVVNREGAGPDKHAEQLEVKIRNETERFLPVLAHALLALELACRLARDLDDARRRHHEIVIVVRKNAREVVRVPGGDPLGGEVCGEVRGQHESSE